MKSGEIVVKEIQTGDFFLLPYTGKKRDLLVKAIQPHFSGQWFAANEDGQTSLYNLDSCDRCPPSLVRRLTKPKKR